MHAELKTCTVCGIPKPATTEFFPVDRSRITGLSHRCRACNAAKSAEHYQANREKQIARVQENKRLHGWGTGSANKPRQPIPELPEDPGATDPESEYQVIRFRSAEWLLCIQVAQQLGLRDAKSLVRQATVTYLAAAGMLHPEAQEENHNETQ